MRVTLGANEGIIGGGETGARLIRLPLLMIKWRIAFNARHEFAAAAGVGTEAASTGGGRSPARKQHGKVKHLVFPLLLSRARVCVCRQRVRAVDLCVCVRARVLASVTNQFYDAGLLFS